MNSASWRRCGRINIAVLTIGLTLCLSVITYPGATGRDDTPAPPVPSFEEQLRLSSLAEDLAGPFGAPLDRTEDLRLPRPDVTAGYSIEQYDNTGGDDKIIFSHLDLTYHDMEIASNGDIYVAVQVNETVTGFEIRVYRSQDGGDSWDLWGEISNTVVDYYLPSIHIAEGTEDLCFVACSAVLSTGAREIRIYRADIADASASFTGAVALTAPDVDFYSVDVTSDAVSYSSYYLYLVANAYDSDNAADIWFARSVDRGANWEAGYRIGTVVSSDRSYLWPRVCYGYGGYVHVAWYIRYDLGSSNDSAVRYRRASSWVGGGITSWDPVLPLTSTLSDIHEERPAIAASPDGDDVVLAYERINLSHTVQPGKMHLSRDQGTTWADSDTTWFSGRLLNMCRPQAGEDWGFGARMYPQGTGFYRCPNADPLSLGSRQVLSDELYWNAVGYFVSSATDPTRSNRMAVVWCQQDKDGGDADYLYFDAEWRGDPGYPNYEDGFPVDLVSGGSSPPAVVNVDADPQLEIVFGDEAGNIRVYNYDGTVASGWPVDVGLIPDNSPVAIGDLDVDGSPELAVGSTDGMVHVFRNNGTSMPGFPVDLGTDADTYVAMGVFGTPYYRLIAVTSGRKLFVLNFLGMQVGTNYPVTFTADHTFGPAIGDVDDDGVTDIVTSRANYIHVHSLDSAVPKMWRNLGAKITNDEPTLADVDFDGDLEIALPTLQGDVYLMHHDGTDFTAEPPNSWPFTVASASPVTSVAFADNLWTGYPEMAFAARDQEVYLMYIDGRVHSAYPKATGTGWFLLGAPVIDAVNVTASSVVIGARDLSAYAWRNTGGLTPGWPKILVGQCNMSPASGDIDLDGNNEYVFVTTTALCVVDVNHPPDVYEDRWPMYAHDPMRTGNLGGEVVVTGLDDPVSTNRLRFALPAPNPARGAVTLEYEVPIRAVVRLNVYDTQGRRVRHLQREEQSPGPHALRWDGRDDHGQALAEGVYFIKLNVAGPNLSEAMTRKVTMLR